MDSPGAGILPLAALKFSYYFTLTCISYCSFNFLMMTFICDLHLHSRYSLATSKNLDIQNLASWGMLKGIHVLGTGDFTHPAWRDELRQTLVDADNGLFKPTPEIGRSLGQSGHKTTLPFFCLQAEISCIYKKNGRTRKIHNLVYAPNFEMADKFSSLIEPFGKLAANGRPILKLDARDLLEIALECFCIVAPAHIWTPWYSLFGSRSGFDHIRDCFEDLTPHIFALETGLSSDPAMNRHLSVLDNFALFSNSDAHSGENLAREANLFKGEPSYNGIFEALRKTALREDQSDLSCQFLGTLEFYPEEGKYHLDGHRACGIVTTPEETRGYNNICPVCGKPLTVGVLNRVMELADRKTVPVLQREPQAFLLAPLMMILSHLTGSSAKSKKVLNTYNTLVSSLGSELDILHSLPIPEITSYWDNLGEAIKRVRSGQIKLKPGFDGEYGKIEIFDSQELKEITSANKKKSNKKLI